MLCKLFGPPTPSGLPPLGQFSLAGGGIRPNLEQKHGNFSVIALSVTVQSEPTHNDINNLQCRRWFAEHTRQRHAASMRQAQRGGAVACCCALESPAGSLITVQGRPTPRSQQFCCCCAERTPCPTCGAGPRSSPGRPQASESERRCTSVSPQTPWWRPSGIAGQGGGDHTALHCSPREPATLSCPSHGTTAGPAPGSWRAWEPLWFWPVDLLRSWRPAWRASSGQRAGIPSRFKWVTMCVGCAAATHCNATAVCLCCRQTYPDADVAMGPLMDFGDFASIRWVGPCNPRRAGGTDPRGPKGP